MGAAESSDTEKASVEQVVQRYRSQIDAEAKLRQKCFDDAHAAYERGEGAKAKQLSEEGKKHSENMKQLQERAAREVFDNANKRFGGDILRMDLHGQTVESALATLRDRVQKLSGLPTQDSGNFHKLTVICGAGNHSAAGAKIGPAIKKFLGERALAYTEQVDHGALFVEVPGTKPSSFCVIQ